MIVLSASDIAISYGKGEEKHHLLGDFNIALEAGTLCAIIGANGVGKSSLLRVLAGLQTPTLGQVHWNAQPLPNIVLSRRPHHMAALFREFSRVDGLTVYDLVSMGRTAVNGSLFGGLYPADNLHINKALELTGMSVFAKRQVANLSDGEFQKAMLAKMLAQNSPIMLLDEPTTHLDLPSSLELMHLLRRLARDEQKTIVFTTHDLHLVFKMAHTVVLLGSEGKYAIGSPEEVAAHSLMCGFLRTDEIAITEGNLQFKISEE